MRPASLAGARLDRYYHVCALFNDRDEEYRVLTSFYREGLEWGEKALHIINPAWEAEHRRRLQAEGLDTSAALDRGQLELASCYDLYLQNGAFDKDRMLGMVDAAIAAGKAAGYPRSRIMGNMGWVFEDHPGSDQLIEYEVEVNAVLQRTQQPAVCVYDVHQLTGAMMVDLLRAHPLTLIGGVVHENPFFTPPEQFLDELAARRRTIRSAA
jgi:hypothetical protein